VSSVCGDVLIYYAKKICTYKLIENVPLSECIITGNCWQTIIYNAKRRKIVVDITREYIAEVFKKQGGYCYLTGEHIILDTNYKQKSRYRTASLDRIDNNLGYIEGNVAWCHKDINQSRKDLPLDYYVELCRMIVEYHHKQGKRHEVGFAA